MKRAKVDLFRTVRRASDTWLRLGSRLLQIAVFAVGVIGVCEGVAAAEEKSGPPKKVSPGSPPLPPVVEPVRRTSSPPEDVVVPLPERDDNACRDDPDTGPEMVVIPGGYFWMGAPDREEGANSSERPVHEVAVQPFALARCEVTVAQFRRFVDATGYRTTAERRDGCSPHNSGGTSSQDSNATAWASPGFDQTQRSPVVCVSDADAMAYITWLRNRTGAPYRLPSEAEWEYAARAGSTAVRYWGDDDPCGYANVRNRAFQSAMPAASEGFDCVDDAPFSAPVASYRPNAFGLYDMLGNVWEWTADCWHDDYDKAPIDARVWEERGDCDRRVARGGAWGSAPQEVRSAARVRDIRGAVTGSVGFRLARTL